MFVKPASPELVVRDPVDMQPIPATGKEVPDLDPYWLRMVADQCVVKADAPAAQTVDATTPKGGKDK